MSTLMTKLSRLAPGAEDEAADGKPTNGRPMSIKTSGHGFVSKAENTAIVEYSTKRNANQHRSAIFNPATAFAALTRLINHASA